MLKHLLGAATRIRFQYVVSVVIVLVLAGCAKEPSTLTPEVIELNDLGVSKMGQFQYAAAFEDFSLVTQEAPHWDEGWVNLAIATLNRQNPDDELLTLQTLAFVLERSPDNVRALYTSGIVNLYLGQTPEAITLLTKALEIDGNDAFTTYFLGQAHLQAGNYADAQQWLLKTLELNPAIRSAYWAAATASRRLEDIERATQLIEEYQAFEHNPLSVNAGFSYKQMGPKAEAKSITSNVVSKAPKPDGPILNEPQSIDVNLLNAKSISSFDVNSDGHWDLLLGSQEESTLLLGSEAGFVAAQIDGLTVPHIASAWGDFDNDGVTELIRCDDAGLVLVTEMDSTWQVRQTVSDVACDSLRVLDTDHDGDLDVVASGSFGVRIFHNDLNGGFSAYEAAEDLGANLAVTGVVAADLDQDRDVDLLLLGKSGDNRVWRNELTWRYELAAVFDEITDLSLEAATVLDIEADGKVEVVTAAHQQGLSVWRQHTGGWERDPLQSNFSNDIKSLESADFDGDGLVDLLAVHGKGFAVIDPRTKVVLANIELDGIMIALTYFVDAGTGPGVVALSATGLSISKPAKGRYPFLAITPTGKSSADQMRSNASGIGTSVKLRADSRWSIASNYPTHSRASQSLQPMLFGSGGADKADYIELLWSDGVTQSEIALDFKELHQIDEIQRQLASCPVVFVWNGEKYEFVSDVLGVAALGYFASPNETTPVRPWERLLLPEGLLRAREGRYEVKIGEPMEEVLYLDAANLAYYDVPLDWSMVLDERLHVQSQEPTGEPIFFKDAKSPVFAYSNLEPDVTDTLTAKNLAAPDPGDVDPRFIGLLADEYVLTVEFDEALPVNDAVLVTEGWVEFPYSQTSFSAFQSAVAFDAPSLEVRDGNGNWHVVAEHFGYPAGMPRQMTLPLPSLRQDSKALRIKTNLEVYWDRIRVAKRESVPGVAEQQAILARAMVRSPGFARRSTGPQRTPYYDYDDRLTHWDSKFASGFYTAMGEATELVSAADSAVAIVGSGEEIHLEFEVPPPVAEGFRRYFVLDFRGWAKDMDLYTTTGDKVEPIPTLGDSTESQLMKRNVLHEKYNVRYQSGMAAR